MELGALVCVPGIPRCGGCPLAKVCMARIAGDAQDLPTRGKSRVKPTQQVVAALLTHQGRWLVGRRPEEGLLGGMWEPPLLEVGDASQRDEVALAIRRSLGLRAEMGERLDQVRHIFTHLDLTLIPWTADTRSEEVELQGRPRPLGVLTSYQEVRWVSQAELKRLPTGVIVRKLFAAQSRPQLTLFSLHQG